MNNLIDITFVLENIAIVGTGLFLVLYKVIKK